MKKMNTLLLLVACSVLILSWQKKHTSKTPHNDIISIEMYCSACLGECPVYKIEVNKNGIATYTGIRWVNDTGVFEKNIGTERAGKIIGKFSSSRVDTCKDFYPAIIDDPLTTLTIKYKSKTKKISDVKRGPAFLIYLAVSLDELRYGKHDSVGWKKTGYVPAKY